MTTPLLPNYVCGTWQLSQGTGSSLFDPVLGNALVRVDATGLPITEAFAYARQHGGAALRAMTYAQRGECLAQAVKVLQARRDHYYEIATANSGTVKNDSAVDIDGAIFTLSYYAKLAKSLGAQHYRLDGDAAALSKDTSFHSQHIQTPRHGLALFINAFNFPAWGLWEKAAPALLSGVPVVIKPATTTAWLTQVMVQDVVEAGVLPSGALNIICGSSAGLLDALQPFDVLSFTGSADTAAVIRSHRAVTQYSVRTNIEADSLNSAILLPDASADSDCFQQLVREVVREMTVKSGQKCTAIRRIMVPDHLLDTTQQAISAKLAKVSVGNPRNDSVRMGALVNREQYNAVQSGLAALAAHSQWAHDGRNAPLVDADPAVACCVAPSLLQVTQAQALQADHPVHHTEVFGPVATLLPYRTLEEAVHMAQLGQGALVTSLYSADAALTARTAVALAPYHGRVHCIAPDVADSQTGHGNVMPMSLHGGPGRAGDGEELGGLRALDFYHQRSAVQLNTAGLAALQGSRQ